MQKHPKLIVLKVLVKKLSHKHSDKQCSMVLSVTLLSSACEIFLCKILQIYSVGTNCLHNREVSCPENLFKNNLTRQQGFNNVWKQKRKVVTAILFQAIIFQIIIFQAFIISAIILAAIFITTVISKEEEVSLGNEKKIIPYRIISERGRKFPMMKILLILIWINLLKMGHQRYLF